MCGIFCSIWHNAGNDDHNIVDYVRCKCGIERRGPDYIGEWTQNLTSNWKGFFAASVLWMQGPKPVEQPCTDSDGNILLWNGDIFSGHLARNDVSDTETLMNALQTSQNVPETLRSIKGPYSVVYYQKTRKTLYFARDPLGRHSLLLKANTNCDKITLSSLASGHTDEYFEVPAIGIYAFNIDNSTYAVHPWRWPESRSENFVKYLEIRFGAKMVVFDPLFAPKESFPILNPEPRDMEYIDRIPYFIQRNESRKILAIEKKNTDIMRPEILHDIMNSLSAMQEIRERIKRVLELLKRSIRLRVEKTSNYCQNCVRLVLRGNNITCKHAKLGILFSGGLDSTVLAALADEFVSKDESIDLLNVAFEKARKTDSKAPEKKSQNSSDLPPNFDVPDRKTGREALAELQKICPWRTWNFVEFPQINEADKLPKLHNVERDFIEESRDQTPLHPTLSTKWNRLNSHIDGIKGGCNITQEELQKYRSSTIRDLVYPLSTILDDSLGCALWFASRASGLQLSTGKRYVSPSRVLLLGMGADELFGGYMRHRTTLRRSGWSAVTDELDGELARISERNLGRDDRVVSDHGRQSRLPYLDEDFVEYVSSLRAWERCNPTEEMPAGLGDKLLLRLAAYDIGLRRTATFPKRAFQFGSRIANSKENAKDLSQWL